MAVPMLDLAAHHAPLRDELEAALRAVLDSQRFILGPVVARFEAAMAAVCGAAHALGVSSGSDALLVALMAAGIGPGDEVITTPFTFFATGGAIARVGATPVFVDIEPAGFNVDPRAVEAAITPATRALLPVHLFGQCADLAPLLDLARRHDLIVIEDAAQAIGAELDGRRAGSLGDYGCFSFFPSKNLGGLGDGGLVTCGDATRHETLKKLRNHGAAPKYHHALIGGNFRLDTLQAAALEVKAPHLDAWTARRQANAEAYAARLADLEARGDLTLPRTLPGRRHVWNQFTIRIPDGRRDAVREALRAADIGHEVYYPVPLHLQACFVALGFREGALPVAEQAAREVLSLPIYPELGEAQIDEVCAALREAM
jgi:dTDP-4-amino-4,6-dideoxygalactose transaminase